jgi:hypothetical protein
MFFSSERHGRRLASWKIIAISGFGRVIGVPSRVMRPEVRSWRPAIDQSNVVLPQPEGPMMQRNSPSRTSMETLSRACTGPVLVL